MAEPLTDLDVVLLERWADATGLREALKELEERLGDNLEALAERLHPWLEERGYVLTGVDRKVASISVGKGAWMKKRDEPLIDVVVAAVYPFGYRRVLKEHPYVWLWAGGLKEDEQIAFQSELSIRLKRQPGGWINDECDAGHPVGRYITTHRDIERARLAQSADEMEEFIRSALESMFALAPQIDAALAVAVGHKGVRV